MKNVDFGELSTVQEFDSGIVSSMKALILFPLMIFLGGCNVNLQDYVVKQNGASGLSYEFRENGCTTGYQNFNFLEEMCRGLMNDELNNYCARNPRQAKFNSQCPAGSQW